MASIINPNRFKYPLPTGHVVPANGSLTCDNALILTSDNARALQGAFLSGQLLHELDPVVDLDADVPVLVPVQPLTTKGA